MSAPISQDGNQSESLPGGVQVECFSNGLRLLAKIIVRRYINCKQPGQVAMSSDTLTLGKTHKTELETEGNEYGNYTKETR